MPGLPITVRTASPADARSLAALGEATFREAFHAQNSKADLDEHCARSFGTEVQAREIKDENIVFLLAETDEGLAGYAQVFLHSHQPDLHSENASELRRFYVAGRYHGRGVAQALMSKAIAVAAQRGPDCLWLGVWERNPRAIAFYRKSGFEVVGNQTFLLGSDEQQDLVLAYSFLGNRNDHHANAG